MTAGRAADLVARLRPHVPRRFDPAEYRWWAPPVGRPRMRRGRADQLAQVLERLAVLVRRGDTVAAAVAAVTAGGDGPVVAEMATVARRLRDGATPADAFRAWARDGRCALVGSFAADLRGCVSADETVAALDRHTGVLRRRAHDERMAALSRRALFVAAVGVAMCLVTAAVLR